VTTVAGVLALGAGWTAVQVIGMHGGPAGPMPWSAAALGLGASVAVGVLAGIAPAQRAASLDPVQTLR
jgi:putative ABC transport system permease protein